MDDFLRNPLAWLRSAAAEAPGAAWVDGQRTLCVTDPAVARAVLANDDRQLREHSDFFGADDDLLLPRSQQVALSRRIHALARRRAQDCDVDRFVQALPRVSTWPTAGNRLLFEIMRPILVGRSRPRGLHRALERLVAHRIMRRHRRARPRPLQLIDRFNMYYAVSGALQHKQAATGHGDLLEAIVETCDPIDSAVATRLFAGFVMSLVGSLGFALGWTIWLALRHGRQGAAPLQLVQEALRLYPIAWSMERYPAADLNLLGHRLGPDQAIMISPFAVHREPRAWPDPEAFRPERWAGRVDRTAWLPFGAGEHACPAAALNVTLTARLVGALFARPVEMIGGDGPPCIGVALACPQFELIRRAR